MAITNSSLVQFKYGTQQAFESITKEDNVIYFLQDTRRIFIGNQEFTRPLLSGTSVPDSNVSATDGSLYARIDTTATPNKLINLYCKTSSGWTELNLSYLAPLNSPNFTGTPTAPTAAGGTNTTQIATTEFVMNAFAVNDAMLFKGTIGQIGATVTALPNEHKQGWMYKVATAGTYAGQTCEVGDMIICVTDGDAANNDHWAVIQTNTDIMVGATSNTNGSSGLVPAPAQGGQDKYLSGDGTWKEIPQMRWSSFTS